MKIYVSGSIYGGTQKIDIYKIMINELEKYGEVLDKQIADINTIENEKFVYMVIIIFYGNVCRI